MAERDNSRHNANRSLGAIDAWSDCGGARLEGTSSSSFLREPGAFFKAADYLLAFHTDTTEHVSHIDLEVGGRIVRLVRDSVGG